MERIPQQLPWELLEGQEKAVAEMLVRISELGHSNPRGLKREGKTAFEDTLEFKCKKCGAEGGAKKTTR